ncbi:hypothetical protein CAEBREN_24985 [Caenorhabditis brenneri]|uniref:DUF7809 domain-containing protein n=1 Tax=Caenorhabditis brenneri TaxID=135651 RepID=G0PLU9_CAEBE|nr:hypothetical protein CAEBREN_24985 [Caenorhabditis brenneri]
MLAQDKVFDNFAILASAIKNYIPKQLLKNVNFEKTYAQNECKYIQKILDSNDHLRIVYGSAESLLEELKMYMNFPLSRKMFPIGMGNYHSTIPKIYKTLKKEHLYCKQDFLFYLQSCVYSELGLDDDEQKVKFEKLIVSMKKHEDRLSGCYEFVKYDHDVFEDIRKPFICSQSLHVFKENPENTVVIADRRGETRIIPDEEKDFVDVFDNLISKYPCFFLPNSETKDKNATAVVRVFGHKYEKFVMESELFAAINLKNPDQKPLESMDIEGHYRTIEYKHVLERYRDQIDAIDKYRYFMDLKLVRKLQEDLEEFWKPMENEPMKRVRNVGPQGFTVEDLKKELKYLGYTKIFPEITDEARAAHAIFFEQNELNTMSMCSAIHEALTRVMFKRYPCLNEFVYRQNEKDAELERLRVYEEKSKKLDETEKKMKDLEKEAEEWKMKRLKILEENVKMGNMLKRSENSIALKRKEVQEKNEQLKLAQKALEEKDQRCKYLDKTLKVKNEEVRNLTEAEKWEKQNKEDYKARVKELESEIKLYVVL